MCDCYGCSDNEKQKCTVENTNIEDYANKEGCSEMVTDFLSCKLDKFHCNATHVTFGDCAEKEMRLENCVKEDVEIWIPGESGASSSSTSVSASSGSSGVGGSGVGGSGGGA